MSVALFGTIYGTVKYKGVEYSLLSFPTDKKVMEKIYAYKKTLKNAWYSSAPWLNNIYVFEVIDKKLYLKFVHCKKTDEEWKANEIEKIFGTDKKEINYTGILKVFSRSKEVLEEEGGIRAWFYMVELEFDKGMLQGIKNVQWKKRAGRILKNYIPE